MIALSSIAMCPVLLSKVATPIPATCPAPTSPPGLEGPDGMPGTGGPGYCIKGEFATNPRNSHVDGALAMARSMDPDSAGSQFYFCLGAQHNLDSGYTVFGTTVEGLDVISQLRAGDEIVHVEIVHE